MDVVNDLSVLVSQHLTFSEHIDRIVQKAACRSYLVFKCFQSRNTKLLVRAFTTYVRPLLEVNSWVWSPHLLKDIQRLEAVQRRFTKKLLGMHAFTYPERLKLLGLERLEDRRIKAEHTICVQTFVRPYSPTSRRLFILCESTCTRGHSYKLFLPRCSTDVHKCFFLPLHRENLE